MKSKEEASELSLNFIKRVETQSGKVIKHGHTDNGTEFARAFDYLNIQCEQKTISTAYSPESNGITERMKGLITNMIHSCIIQSKLSNSYWCENTHIAICV